MPRTRKLHAALLSLLLPGLGQAYIGERARAAATLTMSLSVWAAALLMHVWGGSDLASIASSLGLIYVLVLVPAVREAWQRADGHAMDTVAGDSRLYVLTMLGCLGPLALPLLWQSPRFGRPAKIAWSLLVLVVLAVASWALIQAGPMIEELLRGIRELELTPA